MAVTDLRDAFNKVAAPRYTCQKAKLGYERHGEAEWQRLKFSGIASDGTTFEVKSELLRADTDVNLAAAEVAQKLLGDNRDKPQ